MACSSRGGSSALSSHDSSGMSIQHLSQIGNRSPFPNQPVPPHAAAASSDRNQEDHSIPNRDDMDEHVEYVGTLHRRSSRRKFDATLPKERYTTYANRKPGSRKHIPVDHLPNNGHNSFFIPYGRTIFVKERKTPPAERKSPPEQRKSPPEQCKSPHEQRKSPPEQRKSPPEKQKKRQKKKKKEPRLWTPPGRWIDPMGKWIGSKGVKVTKVHTPANYLGELNLHNSQINNQGNSNPANVEELDQNGLCDVFYDDTSIFKCIPYRKTGSDPRELAWPSVPIIPPRSPRALHYRQFFRTGTPEENEYCTWVSQVAVDETTEVRHGIDLGAPR